MATNLAESNGKIPVLMRVTLAAGACADFSAGQLP